MDDNNNHDHINTLYLISNTMLLCTNNFNVFYDNYMGTVFFCHP